MNRAANLKHEFVEFIPEKINSGVLYVSIPYATAVHKCCCGCGNEVVTPITPTDWQMIFNGETVSLNPSIGNWSFECRSHYWIKNNQIAWAGKWTDAQVKAGRDTDQRRKETHFEQVNQKSQGLLAKLKRLIFGLDK